MLTPKPEPLSDEEEDESIPCRICCKRFVNEVALRNHGRMEHVDAYTNGDPTLWTKITPPEPLSDEEEDKSIPCMICCKMFTNEVALRNHGRMEHMDAYTNGDPTLWTKITLAEPLSDEEEDESIPCRICCKRFVNEVALRNHGRMEHMNAYTNGDPTLWTKITPPKKSISYVEDETQRIQERTRELIAHMEPTSIMRLASKDVSYIIVKSKDDPDLSKKKKEEKQERDNKNRQTRVSRTRKEREPQPLTGRFECLQPSNLTADGTCDRIFFSCCEYSAHFHNDHTRRRKGLKCQVCEKPLSAAATPELPYACDDCGCGEAFATAAEQSAHSASHALPKPYECVQCGKRFTQLTGLQQHQRLHTGHKPFACPVCPKSFTQKSGLEQHLRIHTKVRPYPCVVCLKSFSQPVHLKHHMRTHTNVAPFQCDLCQKRFKKKSHLNYHLRHVRHDPQALSDEQRDRSSALAFAIQGVAVPEKAVEECMRTAL